MGHWARKINLAEVSKRVEHLIVDVMVLIQRTSLITYICVNNNNMIIVRLYTQKIYDSRKQRYAATEIYY